LLSRLSKEDALRTKKAAAPEYSAIAAAETAPEITAPDNEPPSPAPTLA
jgi:hypothetical protein